ncbi:aminotransferase-like domain-containing protein [Cochlodiniinecator piscidefendens]|uniref:aminotransferase-like domain-containing protein n=1 Tax=Cochlodiniinecator piscidefendens TaxID=2715756 RepID=UPI00140C74F1|nr:PLP-dependent aminotransferase family protein [Cochlodiniinecator piscidefendens]
MKKQKHARLTDILTRAIKSGKLAPGSRLPTHRAFAEKSGVALATATRVYKELEQRGLITGEAGRGTFVRDPGQPATLGVHQSDTEGVTDLVFNMPSGINDADMLRSGLRQLALSGDLDAILRYQPHGGRLHERRTFAKYLRPLLGHIDPEQLLITSGGQHGLAMICLGLFDYGDAIAVDTLTYPGFKSAAALRGIKLIPIESKNGVMDPEDLGRKCQKNDIRAVYLMPTVQSPLGSVMDLETRRKILTIAEQHNLTIIEDAVYAFLEENPPASFLSLTPERTVYVSGFAKTLATGLRLGYVIAPPDKIQPLQEAIRATTWNAPALISGLVANWIKDGSLAKSEADRRKDGAQRQEICRNIFGQMPVVSHDKAGFAWVPLENGQRAHPIVTYLQGQNISISGAEAFSTTIATPQALRLAFGGIPLDELPTLLCKVREAIHAVGPQ